MEMKPFQANPDPSRFSEPDYDAQPFTTAGWKKVFEHVARSSGLNLSLRINSAITPSMTVPRGHTGTREPANG
jgi:hypothetical protein